MPKPHRRAAFLFRRDLRLDDNTGLARAAGLAAEVVPCFVFDPRQQAGANDYFSAPAFRFLLESLDDLERQLRARDGRLYRFAGRPEEVVARLIEAAAVDAVFVNRDYTPFARRRDEAIAAACAARGVPFEACGDALLHEPGEVLTGGGGPYRKFTPFWRRARELPVREPQRLGAVAFRRARIGFAIAGVLGEPPPSPAEPFARGGRRAGLAALRRIRRLAGYAERRDLPADEQGTSGLSPHHKFGTVSIRETWHRTVAELGAESQLLSELAWRDFFTHLAWFHPEVFGAPFNGLEPAWDDREERFAAWCAGRTGFPLVDAGMRQLAASGWMHNRVRMVAASFLVKDLHVDWRRGERWFARRLVDYDPCVNNGNWQWAASTGADAVPYFRIFNPWTQQRRFDPECRYIQRWVPELAGLEPAAIHDLATRRPAGLDYPRPIVDHRRESARAKRLYRAAATR
jgi:deoxyribodipyrimidine photo-lyase